MQTLLQALRAAAEPTRLRILGLCGHGELTVTDLVNILGQSQPRVSRHLRLLVEAGLLDRFQEGNWAWYRMADRGLTGDLAHRLVDLIPGDDPGLALDLERLEQVKAGRAQAAEAYFGENAGQWDEVRALHVDQQKVDAALEKVLFAAPVDEMLDIGTGIGSILEMAGPRVKSAIGIDTSREMLSVARLSLDRAGLRNCQVRQADMYSLPFPAARFDLVTLHMVMHYAEDPGRAIMEAARVLRPGGRMVVVDFAPHDKTSLQTEHAHRWLGFDNTTTGRFFNRAGLVPCDPVLLKGTPLTVCIWSAVRPGDGAIAQEERRPAAVAGETL